jgi:hypothetical protein
MEHQDVRTTLTLDEDVAALLEKENRRANEPMKQTVNRLLRTGLAHATPKPKPFKVEPLDFKIPPEWTSGSVQELLDILDGPEAR